MRFMATVCHTQIVSVTVGAADISRGDQNMARRIDPQWSRWDRIRLPLITVGVIACALLAPLRAVADSTGEKSPTYTSGPFTGGMPGGANGFACDNVVAVSTSNGDKQIYWDYGFSIPPTAIVTGIQARVRATD